MATWTEWATQHPDTLVLSRDTGFPRNYDRDPFLRIGESIDNGFFPFPVGEAARDARLAASDLVVGVEASGIFRIYPISLLSEPVNDRIGDLDVVLVSSSATDQALTIALAGLYEDELVKDEEGNWRFKRRVLTPDRDVH